MSIIDCEGFDRFASYAELLEAYPATVSPNITFVSDTKFSRGNAFRVPAAPGNSSNSGVIFQFPEGREIIGFSCMFRMTTFPTTTANRWTLFQLLEGAQSHIIVRPTLTGAIVVNRGSVTSTSTLGQSAGALSLNTWYHLEGRIKISDTEGEIEIRVDGVPIIKGRDLDTRNAGTTGLIDNVGVNGRNNASNAGVMDVDNVVFWDASGDLNNQWLGEVEVADLAPTADDAVQDWTLSSGSDAFSLITSADGDASYIESDQPDDVAQFELSDLDAAFTKVLAVVPFAHVRRDDSGAREITIGVNSNGEVAESEALSVGTTYQERGHIIELNPDTEEPWTPAEVNAMKLRFKVAS